MNDSFPKFLRRNSTDAERKLWQHLRNRRLDDYKFRRQHPLPPFIVDFVCLESRLIVEIDGGQHLEQAAYDENRTTFLQTKGFRVLRFWNDDVLLRTDSVIAEILHALTTPHLQCAPPATAEGRSAGAERAPRNPRFTPALSPQAGRG